MCFLFAYEFPFRVILLSMESRVVDSHKKIEIITMVMGFWKGYYSAELVRDYKQPTASVKVIQVIWGYVITPASHNPFITFLTFMMVVSYCKTSIEISRIIPF